MSSRNQLEEIERYEDLERRFDGPIPPYLLHPKTERELYIGHHRAVVRYCDMRIADFEASTAKLLQDPPSEHRDLWLRHNAKCVAETIAYAEPHRAALRELGA